MGRRAETTIAHAGAHVELTISDARLRKSSDREEIAVERGMNNSCRVILDFLDKNFNYQQIFIFYWMFFLCTAFRSTFQAKISSCSYFYWLYGEWLFWDILKRSNIFQNTITTISVEDDLIIYKNFAILESKIRLIQMYTISKIYFWIWQTFNKM